MVEIRRLDSQIMESFLEFMDGPAFKSQPQWAGCYCQFYLEDPNQTVWSEQTPEQNRAKACERIISKTMQGYVALDGGRTIGWMTANSAKNFPGLPPEDDKVARILCFVIDQEFQGQGVATSLLEFALEDLPNQGFEKVQAAPRASEEFSASGYRGPLSMFLKHGFKQGPMVDDRHCLVQRELTV